MLPTLAHCNTGQQITIHRGTAHHTLKVLSITPRWQPDFWIADNPTHQTLRAVDVEIEINSHRALLVQRPYQYPLEIAGLRLYVEATALWNHHCTFEKIPGLAHDVRFSFVNQSEPWCADPLAYPLANFRWRASSYNNTWCSLVPYNHLYHHAGEDMGAIPDNAPVLAMFDGTVTASPLPSGDARSNRLRIESPIGLCAVYAHMNLQTIDPTLLQGTRVTRGQVLAKSGMTWDGRKSQHFDPHLHVHFELDQTRLSTYPFFVEAYLRSYPADAVLACAGGYHFTLPNQDLTLDATRSILRNPADTASYQWHLSDGRVVSSPIATIRYTQPGLYSEELRVQTSTGLHDRDFASVRVYDPTLPPHRLAYGWFYHWPVRDIRPGQPILFWNRLCNTSPVTIDFGDGTSQPIDDQTTHAYAAPGTYTASLRATGAAQPLLVKMRVVVD